MSGLPPRPAFPPPDRDRDRDRRPPPRGFSPPRRRDERDMRDMRGRPYQPRDPRDGFYDGGRRGYSRERGFDREREFDRSREFERDRGRRASSPRRGGPPPAYRNPSRDRRSPPRGPGRPFNRSPGPPRRRISPRPPFRGRTRSPSPPPPPPRRYSRSPRRRSRSPPRSPPRGRFPPSPSARRYSPSPPPLKRIKLGSHSIGSPGRGPGRFRSRSPERGGPDSRYRSRSPERGGGYPSRSQDSRYRTSRAPSKDRTRGTTPPRPRPHRTSPDSPRDEGEIREEDTPERLIRDPSPIPVLPVVENPTPVSPPPLPISPVHDDKMHSPSPPPITVQAPAEEPIQLPPIRTSSPPKHPRNWNGPVHGNGGGDSPSGLFLPSSLRRRGGGGFRGGAFRGGRGGGGVSSGGNGPPDAPRGPRNWGPLQHQQLLSEEQEQQQTSGTFGARDNTEVLVAESSPIALVPPKNTLNNASSSHTSRSSTPNPQDTLSIELINAELRWMNNLKYIQEERSLMEKCKVLRDDYLSAYALSTQLALNGTNGVSPYSLITATSRAQHEYNISELELQHMHMKRMSAVRQSELASLGVLGMDFEGDVGPKGSPEVEALGIGQSGIGN